MLIYIFILLYRRLKSIVKKTNINVEIPGTEGCTILHLLAGIDTINSKENMLMFLFENGADANARFVRMYLIYIMGVYNFIKSQNA